MTADIATSAVGVVVGALGLGSGISRPRLAARARNGVTPSVHRTWCRVRSVHA